MESEKSGRKKEREPAEPKYIIYIIHFFIKIPLFQSGNRIFLKYIQTRVGSHSLLFWGGLRTYEIESQAWKALSLEEEDV